VNATRDSREFDIDFEWTPDLIATAPETDPRAGHGSLFTAIREQLGLELVPRQMAIDVLVVDHVERPSAN
jgi:uncharacterized protein (TIGR03435 family)